MLFTRSFAFLFVLATIQATLHLDGRNSDRKGRVEEVNALARQVAYGKQGTITARDLQAQKNTASCLALIMACIIYWQAEEINRVILEGNPDAAGVDLALLEHISLISWENVILYGEYVLNLNLIKQVANSQWVSPGFYRIFVYLRMKMGDTQRSCVLERF